ncbi:hypothetical protein NLU13_9862 [Sarocladium strictum]|uniref:Carboxypeptidase n=1 Tax=Sarocladium strictum TaxID=5046 RepID=A0AA39G969_SARSR|nr:hypothetical protein NLU13_9862 [Sarocladium strictum]
MFRLLPFSSLLFACSSLAQFVEQDEQLRNLTTVRSPADANITVSFKEPDGACSTAFDSQKQYTGWVNIPGDYPTNLFFWFVGARQQTDSLTIWLNGGPGSSSMYGLFTGNGPCEVIAKGLDEYETVAREWGWDRASNMLFIDQPNQVGYSYNTPTNGTLRIPDSAILQPPQERIPDVPAWGFLNGTFSDKRGDGATQTANTTELAATAVWHMLQGLLSTIPPFANSTNSLDVHLFAESYGGRYGPIFAETFETQNRMRLTGALDPATTKEINLVSLGIVNGCIDREVQVPQYPVFANNNTYGVKAISDREAAFIADQFNAKDGCRDMLSRCARAAAENDPDGEGDDESVNKLCSSAVEVCSNIEEPYYNSKRGAYDLAANSEDPFPSMIFEEYLNQAWVQRAIGSPINFTTSSTEVFKEFQQTGDVARDGNIPRLAALLNSGVRVGLIYGDRDYICNWFGGEAVSLRLAQEAGAEYGNGFQAAGYAPIIVNDSYIGGAVRQFGNLSFSRVYQAGHAVAAYQPETAFQIFARILAGGSVSTGSTAISLSNYTTSGPREADEKQKLPDAPAPTCYVRSFASTCDSSAKELAASGQGVVINGVLYREEQDWPLWEKEAGSKSNAETSTKATQTATPTKTEALTGAFTATNTPGSDGDKSAAMGMRIWKGGLVMALMTMFGVMW